jgi:hypothetical protein
MIGRYILILLIVITTMHAFHFDKWKSGVTLEDVVQIAYENNIPITKGSFPLIQNKFDWRHLRNYQKERELKYYTSLFGKKALVRLYFTQATKRLYKIQISWGHSSFSGDKDEFENMLYVLLDKKYGTRNIGMPSDFGDYVFNKYRYWIIDKQTKIIAKRNASGIYLIYQDNNIVQEHEKVKQKKKLKIIMKDAAKI